MGSGASLHKASSRRVEPTKLDVLPMKRPPSPALAATKLPDGSEEKPGHSGASARSSASAASARSPAARYSASSLPSVNSLFAAASPADPPRTRGRGAKLRPSPALQDYVESMYAELIGCTEGEVATYIPELGKAEPDEFGMSIVTLDGVQYEAGDKHRQFTIQSVSKPFVLALALQDRGEEYVLSRVGVEPTGEAFNVLSVDEVGHPKNPLINAGAIAMSCAVAGDTADEKFDGLLHRFSQFAGRRLDVSNDVYSSESRTGHRNRGYAYLLKQAGTIDENVDPAEAVQVYFKQCSILVDVHDLAIMAGTLANGGVNPITNVRVVSSSVVEKVLGVMTTCGMYDSSGAWIFRVGIPAKSGVGGGIMAVLPGQLAVATYSPRLDHIGHSVRGVKAITRLADDMRLHFLSVGRAARSVLRCAMDLCTARSRRARPANESKVIERNGTRYLVLLLQGDLSFAPVERVLREIGFTGTRRGVVLDLKHVSKMNMAAMRLVVGLAATTHLLLSHTHPYAEQLKAAAQACNVELFDDKAKPSLSTSAGLHLFQHLDGALDWAEEELLLAFLPDEDRCVAIEPAQHPYLATLEATARDALLTASDVRRYSKGDPLFRVGDTALGIFLIIEGSVDVSLPSASAMAARAGRTAARPSASSVTSGRFAARLRQRMDSDESLGLGASFGALNESFDAAAYDASLAAANEESKAADGPSKPAAATRTPDRWSLRTARVSFRPQAFRTLVKVKDKMLKLRSHRLASLGVGSALGEEALVDNAARNVDAFASGDTACVYISVSVLAEVCTAFPQVRVHLLTSLLLNSTETVARLNREVSMLTR